MGPDPGGAQRRRRRSGLARTAAAVDRARLCRGVCRRAGSRRRRAAGPSVRRRRPAARSRRVVCVGARAERRAAERRRRLAQRQPRRRPRPPRLPAPAGSEHPLSGRHRRCLRRRGRHGRPGVAASRRRRGADRLRHVDDVDRRGRLVRGAVRAARPGRRPHPGPRPARHRRHRARTGRPVAAGNEARRRRLRRGDVGHRRRSGRPRPVER